MLVLDISGVGCFSADIPLDEVVPSNCLRLAGCAESQVSSWLSPLWVHTLDHVTSANK